jgi:hypothetical protein
MMNKARVALTAAMIAGAVGVSIAVAGSSLSATSGAAYHPVLDPAHFVAVIDNPYYPLPVGRTLIYRGVKDGTSQTDRVHVTSSTKVIEGVTATVITDVAKHRERLLEKTKDWYAQDDQGNVWYLGENTKAYEPDGPWTRRGRGRRASTALNRGSSWRPTPGCPMRTARST